MTRAALRHEVSPQSESYFLDAPDSVEKGKVETPASVVDFMISTAFSKTNENLTNRPFNISWLDPACGTGAFVIGILEFYLNSFPKMTQTELPRITSVEIDPLGIEISKQRISDLLLKSGFDFHEYVDSGRLKLIQGDFLNLSGTSSNLFEGAIGDIDIAIGNPPYVRSNKIEEDQKARIRLSHPDVFEGSTDLYGYFYTGCTNVLSQNGLICLITPVNFMKSVSFIKVRRKLRQECFLHLFVDFGERPIFRGASVHTGIFLFKHGADYLGTHVFDISRGRTSFSLDELETLNPVLTQISDGVGGTWTLKAEGFERNLGIHTGKTLKSAGLKVFSGVRTGKASAYLLDANQLSKFNNPESHTIFEPIVMPTDIKAWESATPSRHLINITQECETPSSEVLDHLKSYKAELSDRHEVSEPSKWYQLRKCDYLDEMRQLKIIFPDISITPRFGLGKFGDLISDGAYFIDSTDLALLAILNSEFAFNHFKDHCLTIGSLSNGGRLRIKKNIVLDFPLPKCWGNSCETLDILRSETAKFMSSEKEDSDLLRLNTIVNSLYEEHRE